MTGLVSIRGSWDWDRDSCWGHGPVPQAGLDIWVQVIERGLPGSWGGQRGSLAVLSQVLSRSLAAQGILTGPASRLRDVHLED